MGSGGRDIDEGTDDIGTAPHLDGLPFGDGGGAGPVDVAVAGGAELGPGGGQDLQRGPVVEGERLVGPGFGEPDVDQFPNFVGVFGGQVAVLVAVESTWYSSQSSSLKWPQPERGGWVVTAFHPSCQMDREPSMA